jgi:hypothetical protein
LPGDPSRVATTVRLRHRSAGNLISSRILNGYVEIPIERAAPLPPTSRGFLPWRLSDDLRHVHWQFPEEAVSFAVLPERYASERLCRLALI